CLERLDLWVGDSRHDVPRRVLAISDTHHQLVDQRQQRADALLGGISVLDRVANDREAGYLHDVEGPAIRANDAARAGSRGNSQRRSSEAWAVGLVRPPDGFTRNI